MLDIAQQFQIKEYFVNGFDTTVEQTRRELRQYSTQPGNSIVIGQPNVRSKRNLKLNTRQRRHQAVRNNLLNSDSLHPKWNFFTLIVFIK